MLRIPPHWSSSILIADDHVVGRRGLRPVIAEACHIEMRYALDHRLVE
jgi:hypothetical protein